MSRLGGGYFPVGGCLITYWNPARNLFENFRKMAWETGEIEPGETGREEMA
jgi:hypothetical protein